ncbi:hypothetical protein IAU60_004854 [Kwoniella sp. DSM 27419]
MDAVNHIELTVHPSQVRSTLRSLLLAIYFHRLLDAAEPETLELLDAHIAYAPNAAIEREINGKIEDFAKEYLEQGRTTGEIALVFLQKRPKKGWFAITEELVPWEEHLITLHFPRPSAGGPTVQSPSPLTSALLRLVTFCAEKKDNVPPLVDGSSMAQQILVAPPSPTELFSPSPPTYPQRLTSPPPAPLTHTTATTATARDTAHAPTLSGQEAVGSARRGISPATGTLGYLEQAKDGLRAVGAKAGAGVGWGGRAMGAAFGRGGG